MRFSSWRLRRAATLSPDGREFCAVRRTGRCFSVSRTAWISALPAGTAAAVDPETAGAFWPGGGSTQEPGVGGLRREGVIGLCADAATATVNIARNTDPPKIRFIITPRRRSQN